MKCLFMKRLEKYFVFKRQNLIIFKIKRLRQYLVFHLNNFQIYAYSEKNQLTEIAALHSVPNNQSQTIRP